MYAGAFSQAKGKTESASAGFFENKIPHCLTAKQGLIE